ncbi:MAG: hypothetical protein ACOX0J_07425 [Thermoactinomyces vulgaris]
MFSAQEIKKPLSSAAHDADGYGLFRCLLQFVGTAFASCSLGAKPDFFANPPPAFPYVLRYVKILLVFMINYIKRIQKAVFLIFHIEYYINM